MSPNNKKYIQGAKYNNYKSGAIQKIQTKKYYHNKNIISNPQASMLIPLIFSSSSFFSSIDFGSSKTSIESSSGICLELSS